MIGDIKINEYIEKIIKNNISKEILEINEINGGWLTEKYKIKFDEFSIMIKIIEDKKIKRRNINIELATSLLELANQQGIKTPKIYRINNKLVNYDYKKRPIVCTEFIEDSFCKDYTNITKEEVYIIGKEVSKMRTCFDNNARNLKFNKLSKQLMKNIISDYEKRIEVGVYTNNKKYLEDVIKQKKVIDAIDETFISSLKIGYCHGDLSSDNILFDKKGFRAITDFELANVSFVLIDIARIFLTFCLDDKLNINKEFLKELLLGYKELNDITIIDLCMGLRILWCLEVNLWSKEAYYEDINPPKVDKFISEINWITDNWFELEKILEI